MSGKITNTLIIITSFLLLTAMVTCVAMKVKESNSWEGSGEPTICYYEVAIIYRSQFRAGDEGDKDFAYSVASQVEWLENHDFEVLSLEYKYAMDIVQNLRIRFALIKYKEIKNGIKKKESN